MFVPNILFSVGQGAIVPVVTLLALELGASPALAGFVVALRGLGHMVFDLPAGALVSRLGERRSMIVSGLALAAAAGWIGVSGSIWTYAVLSFFMGFTWSVWILARIEFATVSAPTQFRGRVMSSLGGMHRVGMLFGPLLGSVTISRWGPAAPFFLMSVLSLAASASMLTTRDRSDGGSFATRPSRNDDANIRHVVRTHGRMLATAGSVAVTSQILRSSREVLIPLWGNGIGVATETISLIFAASAALETILFYPAGMLMDRRGRKWAAIPAMALLTVGIATVPLTSDVTSLTLVAGLMGIANGLGTGMNMTLGSDLSPSLGRSPFLAIWRLLSDAGSAGGPFLVAGTTAVAGLGASALAVGLVGVAGTAVLWRLVPETLNS